MKTEVNVVKVSIQIITNQNEKPYTIETQGEYYIR